MLALTLAGLLRGVVGSRGGGRRSRPWPPSPRSSTRTRCRGASRRSSRSGWCRCWRRSWRSWRCAPGAEDARVRLPHCSRLRWRARRPWRRSASRRARGWRRCCWWRWSLVVRREGPRWRRTGIMAAGFAAVLAVLSLPTLLDLGDYLDVTREVVTTQEEFGNLLGPLDVAQVFGMWLEGDYRVQPPRRAGNRQAGADVRADRRGRGRRALLGAPVARCGGARSGRSSSSAVSIVALVVRHSARGRRGPTARRWRSPRRRSCWPLCSVRSRSRRAARGWRRSCSRLVLAVGVVSSNAFVYHDVSLAPRDRLEELEERGRARGAGAGPLLYTEFEEMGKHFLRDAEPVGAAEAFTVPGLTPAAARAGGGAPFGYPVDVARARPGRRAALRRRWSIRRSPDGRPRRPPATGSTWSGRLLRAVAPRAAAARRARRRRRSRSFATADEQLPGGWAPRHDDPRSSRRSARARSRARVRVPRPATTTSGCAAPSGARWRC